MRDVAENTAALATKCRSLRRGSFMTMLLELSIFADDDLARKPS
jgi:hypothetical protein